jgi:predicted XRE-type DNA-binding protein
MTRLNWHRTIHSTNARTVDPSLLNASVGQRWRFRRNIVIYVAARAGLTHRHLSEVFGLQRSRISCIIEDLDIYDNKCIHGSAEVRQAGSPVSLPPPPLRASVGQRWRFRRNIVIYVAARAGLTQRHLSEVFDLPRSRISTIHKEFSKYETAREQYQLDLE